MTALVSDIAAFRARKHRERAEANQTVALFLMSRTDLTDALSAAPEEKARLVTRLERLIERERLRGVRSHWSYDLNRHIALKQVLDRLRAGDGKTPPGPSATKMARLRRQSRGASAKTRGRKTGG